MSFLDDPQPDYVDETFKGLDAPGVEVEGIEFEGCTFRACTFSEATFRRCKFLDCSFKDCDLSLLRPFETTFSGTRFEGCKLAGVDWTTAYWPKIGGLEPNAFVDCTLNYATFIGLNLKGLRLERCTARDVDFTEVDLTRAACTGTDFSESRFIQTDLTEADFTGATNYAIDATLNKLKKTKFALPEAVSLLRSLDIILVDPDAQAGG